MNSFNKFIDYVLNNNSYKESLLTTKESTGIKGLLAILIIIGHNKYLMNESTAFYFLYSFHVYAFFFLPFLYNFKNERTSIFLKKNLTRLYIPYTVFYCILLIICIYQNSEVNVNKIALAYITGNQIILREVLGSGGFLWFIPTMFLLLIIKALFIRSNQCIKKTIICLSFVSYIIYIFDLLPNITKYVPFNGIIALALFFPALISRYFFKTKSNNNIGLIALFSIILFLIIEPNKSTDFVIWRLIFRVSNTISMYLLILSLRESLLKKLFIKLGEVSFQIYLIHIFLYNILYIILDRFELPNLLSGSIALIFTSIFSYIISTSKILNTIFIRHENQKHK